MYKCPECGGTQINQYRMPFGAMWCMTCGFRVEDKNKVPNPFVEAAKNSAKQAVEPDRAVQRDDQDSADAGPMD
jgi:transcription initiation factor TFIIIB Brf1 subunit/transcription initiation factor TFIIB